MDASLSTRNYDLFKLIVALILLALLLMFLFSGKPAQPAPPPTVTQETGQATPIPPTVTSRPPATATALPAATVTSLPPATETAPAAPALPDFPASSQALSLDAANQHLLAPDGSAVYALDAEAAHWLPVIPDDLAAALPKGYQLTEPTPDHWEVHAKENGDLLLTWDPDALVWQPPAESAPAQEAAGVPSTQEPDCPLALPPRLQVGKQARVITNLNMRSSPGIQNNWLLTNPRGTILDVMGGPVCTLYEGGAFLWWEVKNPAGKTGWSAEARQQGTSYFLEPLP